jgi:HSP20 family protein
MNAPAQIPVKSGAQLVAHPAFNVFGSLQREIDRLFEDFTPTLFGGRTTSDIKCRMDLAETKDGLELTAELPGLEEKDVEVTMSNGLLTVSGEKRFENEEKDKNYHFIERGYGSFSRSISLPDGVNADQITATMNNGVLKVAIPTPNKPAPKKIKVKAKAAA